jgi:hypothetical protein
MPQLNMAGVAGQAGRDGVAAGEPAEGAGAEVGAGPPGLAAGEDSRLHPASAAPATATVLIAERSATAGSIRTVALVPWPNRG